ALTDWLAVRPEPKREADAGLVFLTVKRLPWSVANRSLSHEFEKLAKRVGVPGGRGFYALRHVFQTIGDESGDFLAVRKIMGHASNDIADVYRERVSDVRLRRVTDHVRGWLLGTG
ncbi:MAG TPA: hypothetical protein VM597_10390, partial [Gemmataceae bacterium]|nr:hypothetical protein [Gemmataceae bacterium]